MTTQINYSRPNVTYLNVLADGKFHQTVAEGTEGAKRRDYETSDGKKGTKFELIVDSIQGIITNLDIYEGDFGNQLKISFGEGEEEIVVSLPTSSSFGIDFMKKLPNINFEQEIKLAPYSFEAEGKKKKGMTVYQGPELKDKIQSKYQETVDGKVTNTNGFPNIPKESMKTKDWQKYFIEVSEFLEEEIKKNSIYNKRPRNSQMTVEEKLEMYPKEEIKPEDVAF